MNSRVWIGLGVAASAITAAFVAFVLAAPSSTVPDPAAIVAVEASSEAAITPDIPTGEAPTVAEPEAPGAEPVGTPEAPKVPVEGTDRERPRRAPVNEEPLVIDGKPEDGGLALGDAVCSRMQACGCRGPSQRTCTRAWGWSSKAEFSELSCLLEVGCSDLCATASRSGGGACRASVDAVMSRRFDGR